jgi:hypothetical protein
MSAPAVRFSRYTKKLSICLEWRAWSAHPGPEEKALLEIAKPQIGALDSVEHILFNKQVLPEKKIYTIV